MNVEFRRQQQSRTAKIELPAHWRRESDISWRTTSYDLSRMATGGMRLEALSQKERRELNLKDGKMALRARHVGRYGDHGRAMRAGLRKGDVVIEFGGRDDLMTEAAVFEFAIQQKRAGEKVPIVYLRNGQQKTTHIKLQ